MSRCRSSSTTGSSRVVSHRFQCEPRPRAASGEARPWARRGRRGTRRTGRRATRPTRLVAATCVLPRRGGRPFFLALSWASSCFPSQRPFSRWRSGRGLEPLLLFGFLALPLRFGFCALAAPLRLPRACAWPRLRAVCVPLPHASAGLRLRGACRSSSSRLRLASASHPLALPLPGASALLRLPGVCALLLRAFAWLRPPGACRSSSLRFR